MKTEQKLTSVNILNDVYKKFKVKSIEGSINLQKLVNRSMDLSVSLIWRTASKISFLPAPGA